MNDSFEDRVRSYFPEDWDLFLKKMKESCSQALFLNTKKADREQIISLIDFPLKSSSFTKDSFYYETESIGKSKPYELGLIYPQEIAASLTSAFINDEKIRTVVDMCAAPGGKTINIMNRLSDQVLCVSNDMNHERALTLSSNLERLGLDNTIITNKETSVLSQQLCGWADLVILDAPCSGEGMIRKYPEILDTYSLSNIRVLASTQSQLLEDAYEILRCGGYLIYSTCTFAFEEDEDQVLSFLEKHPDMSLVPIEMPSYSLLKGTVKLSFQNETEGQFFALMKKEGNEERRKIKELKTISDKSADEFIRKNLDLDGYYLYKYNEHFYLSLRPLPDLKSNIIRYGIYLGDAIKNRFEPSHSLYRANSLIGKFRYVYDVNDEEYEQFISGNELKIGKEANYYLITYRGLSLGFGKCSNGILKNKYPKGLRRML